MLHIFAHVLKYFIHLQCQILNNVNNEILKNYYYEKKGKKRGKKKGKNPYL